MIDSGNPLPELQIEPWLEEEALPSAPGSYTNVSTNRIANTYTSLTNQSAAIQLQESVLPGEILWHR